MILQNYQNLKLHYDKRFSVEFGAINRNNPEVIHIGYKTYLSSNSVNNEYKPIIDSILKKFKKDVGEKVRKTKFNRCFIFDYDILQGIQAKFKNKILTFELYLKQPKDNIVKVANLKEDVLNLSKELTDLISEYLQSNNIELTKAKKK